MSDFSRVGIKVEWIAFVKDSIEHFMLYVKKKITQYIVIGTNFTTRKFYIYNPLNLCVFCGNHLCRLSTIPSFYYSSLPVVERSGTKLFIGG